MTITTRDGLVDAMGNKFQGVQIDKGSLANTAAGQLFSLFTATGLPVAGTTPGSGALCDNTTSGALTFTNPTGTDKTYLALLTLAAANAATSVEIVDRLAHMGGLSGTSATSQTATLDPATLGISAARRGASNYSEVQWWLEVYAQLGATNVNATVNVDYSDGTLNQNLTAFSLGTNPRIGRMYPLHTIATAGKYISKINSVTLSATTGTAGNFGFSCTRPLSQVSAPTANFPTVSDWAQLGLPAIPDSASIFLYAQCSTTTTGTLRGYGKLVQG
jgi:hypothetical protein